MTTRLEEHIELRREFTWGSYGKDGKGPLVRSLLCELTNAHIEAILLTQPNVDRVMFAYELCYRECNNIMIEDDDE